MRTRYLLSSFAVILALVAPYSPFVRSAMAEEGFCVYENRNFNRWGGDEQCSSPPYNVDLSLNDKVSSIKNKTHTTWCVFVDADRGGYSLPVGGGSQFRDLALDTAPDGSSWNDRISSVGQCPPPPNGHGAKRR